MLSDPQIHYLDNAATTRVDPAVTEVIHDALVELWANPSSLYDPAVAAQDGIETARARIAKTLHCRSDEIYFTACGSESNNMAIYGAAMPRRHWGNKIVVTGFEHPSVQLPIRALKEEGFTVVEIAPERDGHIDTEKFLAAVDKNTVLAACMAVNNETGARQDIAALAKGIKAKNSRTHFHVDAVQAWLRIPIDLQKWPGVDTLSVSGHKIHAPKGIGAMYIRKGLKISPFIRGGGQENGLRSGTEATGQLAALAAAVTAGRATLERDLAAMADLKQYAMDRLKSAVPQGKVLVEGGAPHILPISLVGYKSEVVVRFLSDRGVYISSGSACHKGKPSHVYAALKLPKKEQDGALRLSFSYDTTREDIDALVEGLQAAQAQLFPSMS